MTIVLFNIESGRKISEFISEDDARSEMRTANGLAGWRKLAMSWTDGIECEWASNRIGDEARAPYGITELDRWEEKFRPEFVQQRNDPYAEERM